MIIFKADVFCDVCYDWTDGGDNQKDKPTGMVKTARVIAKSEGWKRVKAADGTLEDICPECVKRNEVDIINKTL